LSIIITFIIIVIVIVIVIIIVIKIIIIIVLMIINITITIIVTASTVMQDVLTRVHATEDDSMLITCIRGEFKHCQERSEHSKAVANILMMQLINTACHDHGSTFQEELIMPYIRGRLDAEVKLFWHQQAAWTQVMLA